MDDLIVDCEQCGKRTHIFWQDPVGKFIVTSGCPDHLLIRFVISHKSRGYNAQFMLRRFLELRWVPQLIMDGTKVLSMSVENLHFLESLNFMLMSIKSMPKSFGLTCKRGIIPVSLKRIRIWIMWALSRTQILWGRVYVR